MVLTLQKQIAAMKKTRKDLQIIFKTWIFELLEKGKMGAIDMGDNKTKNIKH
jgi:hypothetical protein